MSTKKFTSKDLYKDFGDLSFGEILSSFRQSENLTQTDFAKRLQLTAANLCDLEKGRKIPSPIRAVRIAKKLGLSEAFLVQVSLQDSLKRMQIKFKVLVSP